MDALLTLEPRAVGDVIAEPGVDFPNDDGYRRDSCDGVSDISAVVAPTIICLDGTHFCI